MSKTKLHNELHRLHSLGRISVKLETPPSSVMVTIVVSKEDKTYVAYPLEIAGVVADGRTYKQVCKNIKDAIKFHVESFGSQVLTDLSRHKIIDTAKLEVAISV